MASKGKIAAKKRVNAAARGLPNSIPLQPYLDGRFITEKDIRDLRRQFDDSGFFETYIQPKIEYR